MSEPKNNARRNRRAISGAADFAVLPELLSPAGSPAALEAAIEGGADTVYFGGSRHNARAGAVNFKYEDICRAASLSRAFGVRTYMTLNTLATDRELAETLEDARAAYAAGVDALIVADLGVAAAIHRSLPDFELHASTQASGHSVASAVELAKLGFSRMVCAREMSLDDIRRFTENSPIEAEVFVHGALCVCHSGQCLFSSLVGGRSGNRGECAQPCRLPYRSGNVRYPLSLKDLSLARHIPELIDARVASLKIEGRMKSPEYVLAVTSVFRRLLDENRAATPDEMSYLASIFSRGGFTDGYFVKKINSSMLGVRSEDDKSSTRSLPPFGGLTKKIPLDMSAVIRADAPMELTVSDGTRKISVCADIPEAARSLPTDRDTVIRNLTKLGGTPYSPANISVELDDGLAIPVSKLNALRRSALSALDSVVREPNSVSVPPKKPYGKRQTRRTASFTDPARIPHSAYSFFDLIYLPSAAYDISVKGVALPPVIFDSERDIVRRQLENAAKNGATDALVGNIGHISLAREAGLIPHGGFRLNVTNTESVAQLESLGLCDVILSPELTLPQARDIRGDTSVIIYGRIPLMVVEKCVSREIADCDACNAGRVTLTDRRGVNFPVQRTADHRNIIYNSLPTCMSDRQGELARFGITAGHFIFSTESAKEADAVITAFRRGEPLRGAVRRI